MFNTNIDIYKYRPITKGTYSLKIWGLPMQSLSDGRFRVELINNDDRLMECFDLNLRWAAHRKYLENYICRIKSYGSILDVWFSSSGLLGDNWYSKESFIKAYSFYNLSFLNDLNLETAN